MSCRMIATVPWSHLSNSPIINIIPCHRPSVFRLANRSRCFDRSERSWLSHRGHTMGKTSLHDLQSSCEAQKKIADVLPPIILRGLQTQATHFFFLFWAAKGGVGLCITSLVPSTSTHHITHHASVVSSRTKAPQEG